MIDENLIDIISSAKSWLLVGSGPSIEMGYPTWQEMTNILIRNLKLNKTENELRDLIKCYEGGDYPRVFNYACAMIGLNQVRIILGKSMKAKKDTGKIYEMIAQWPIDVYLTTNYDDEIDNHLRRINEAYQTYCNSSNHFEMINESTRSSIFKIHGDFNQDDGLILSSDHYKEIKEGDKWDYWRVKMTSIFQMKNLVIIGHSLNDANIKHVLDIAKEGIRVDKPIYWLTPDVDHNVSSELLIKKKINVVPYSNDDGTHRNLVNLIEMISDYIPKRTSVEMGNRYMMVGDRESMQNASAAGIYVFNKLSTSTDIDEKRTEIIMAAIKPSLVKRINREITIRELLGEAGWPDDLIPISAKMESKILEKMKQSGVLIKKNSVLVVSENVANVKDQRNHEHLRNNFCKALEIKLRNKYPDLQDETRRNIIESIESSLVYYFRECGLSLATTLFYAGKHRSSVPKSIAKYINEASLKFKNMLERQAFCKISLDSFIRATHPEREYLGQLSQGYFIFHALGTYGDVAREKITRLSETVWLLDSEILIILLANMATANGMYTDCIKRLKDHGMRLFTTRKLLDETYNHLHAAKMINKEAGADVTLLVSSAEGTAPYYKANRFVEGYINWKAIKKKKWVEYLTSIFGTGEPNTNNVNETLNTHGIEVNAIEVWPGYDENDKIEIEENINSITGYAYNGESYERPETDIMIDSNKRKKAIPEAEVVKIIKEERTGVIGQQV